LHSACLDEKPHRSVPQVHSLGQSRAIAQKLDPGRGHTASEVESSVGGW
jgi:hypothetical protein